MWKPVAAAGLAVAGLTTLGYAGWLVTVRREVFLVIAGERAGAAVTPSLARSSDADDAAWLWATGVLVVAALLLWTGARLAGGAPLGSIGFIGVVLVAAGVVGVAVGAGVASLTGPDGSAAARAALGCVVTAGGLLLVSAGHFCGVASLLRHPSAGRAPYLGYSGWSAG